MARDARKSVRLDEAIEAYLNKIQPERLAKSTLVSKRRTLTVLTEAVGRVNRGVRKLTEDDFLRCLTLLAEGLSPEENAARRRKGLGARTGRTPRAMQGDRATLKQFVEFCKHEGWMKANFYPMLRLTMSKRGHGNKDSSKVFKRRSVPESEWAALLEAADQHHPRTRMIVAAGLFWGRRSSETSHLQWKHIHPDGTVEFFNLKRNRPVSSGRFQISPWMQAELGRWRAWVEAQHGPIQPDWYLCPAKVAASDPRIIGRHRDTRAYLVEPTRQMAPRHVHEDIHAALRRHGWTAEELYGEGGHTLRRSAGQYMEGIAGPEAAQAMYDHESLSQTQHYTGNRAGHQRMNAAMADQKAPAPQPPAPVQADPPAVEGASNVVDFAAWRSRRAG